MAATVFCISASVKRLGDYILFEFGLLIPHLSVSLKSLHLPRKSAENVSVYLRFCLFNRPMPKVENMKEILRVAILMAKEF